MIQSDSRAKRSVPPTRIVVLVCICATVLTYIGFAPQVVARTPARVFHVEEVDEGAALSVIIPPRNADTDGDGVEDALDVCCQTPPGIPVDAGGRPLGDVDLDCDVDHADFAIIQRAFTGPLIPCDTEICDNGLDDDDDTFIDCDDFDCNDDPACVGEICDNGLDDDDDAFVDCDDFDCTDDSACIEEICDNGVDDDDDGWTDCDDFDCADDPGCL
jgi:hypothetical protein